MKKPLNPEADFRAWINKAESDLRTAEHTLTLEESCPFDTAFGTRLAVGGSMKMDKGCSIFGKSAIFRSEEGRRG
jgi:hypothetical protein